MATRIYYKHTRVEDTKLPYRFKCESCAKDSGELQAHIVGDKAIYNSNYKTIDEYRAQKLEAEAHDNLVKKVKKIHDDATQKDIYCTDFKDNCPHCGKPQSWGVSGLKKERFGTPLVILILGIFFFVIALIGYYYDDSMDYLTLPIVFGILGAFAAVALIVLIYNSVKISLKTKATSATGIKEIPKIKWEKARALLDEADQKTK